MKSRSSSDLLAALRQRTQRNKAAAEALLDLPDATLNRRPGEKRWSALEALEHVNRYGYFYLPAIETAIREAPPADGSDTFTSAWLGNKFAAGMKPGPKTRKVKTFPSMNPLGSRLDRSVVTTFIGQQDRMLELLEEAGAVDLTRAKVATSISRFLKLRLGDGLRVVINHNWRHLEQALRAAGVAEGVVA